MVAAPWRWDIGFVFRFGWKAVIGIALATACYLVLFPARAAHTRRTCRGRRGQPPSAGAPWSRARPRRVPRVH
ncbi:MAG: putative Na+/H+ antiporter [Planctomycetota bacterium]